MQMQVSYRMGDGGMDDEGSVGDVGVGSGGVAQSQSQSQVGSQSLKGRTVRSEDIYEVITGASGLKPLLAQHTPDRRVGRGVERPDPSVRKAKMAAHLKELVRVTAPSLQGYGYSDTNPFYVLEGHMGQGLMGRGRGRGGAGAGGGQEQDRLSLPHISAPH
ncbi:hypothetical protein B484DRAFT_455550 [Ochromonadaceae sp. CCMP2298]|nr:hypothetical protein B484DRAFT_455550 [Ochromonadaceae sp. CCMP2298]